RDERRKDFLPLMPANRYQGSVQWDKGQLAKNIDYSWQISIKHVTEQKKIPSNFNAIDYPKPPKDYTLLDASWSTTFHLKNKNQSLPILMRLTTQNHPNITPCLMLHRVLLFT